MSYINQDPDIIVPFKGKEMVAKTRRSWMEEQYEGLSSMCWCGAVPGSCPDCQDCDAMQPESHVGKLHVGSGEDADFFR